MDAHLRQTLAGAFLATGCLCSASSHAYSAADDAEAQDREVKAAYDRGYKAAKEDLAREAATKGTAATTPPATEARAQKPTSEAARKPILDIKHVYSDASEIETVQEVPVTSKPLGEQAEASAVPIKRLKIAALPAAEEEDVPAIGLLVEQWPHQRRQAIKTKAHAHRCAGEVHLGAGWERNHAVSRSARSTRASAFSLT